MLNNRNLKKPEEVIEVAARPVNRIYIVKKNDRIGCAMQDINGETSIWYVEDYPYGRTEETCTANIIHELNCILEEIRDETEYPGCFVFAIYTNIHNLVTNIEVYTKQLMFHKAFISHTKHGTETIPEIKNWNCEELSPEFEEEYKTLLVNIIALLGRVTFEDSKFISDTKDPYWKGMRTLAYSAINAVLDEEDEYEEEEYEEDEETEEE